MMDVFVEQIVAIKKTGKDFAAYVGIVLLALILMLIAYLFLTSIFIAVAAAVIFGAFKLILKLNVEYEYIVTNGTMDIDKIIAKSSRKRMISFDVSSIQRVEKFTGILPNNIEKDCFFACNKNDENAFVVYYKEEGKHQQSFVFAPNEKVREAIKSVLPRYVGEHL